MQDNIKDNLIAAMKQNGAFDVRLADPHVGFKHSPEGRHPLQLWPQCNTVICFAVARPKPVAGFGFGSRRSDAMKPIFTDKLYLCEEEAPFYSMRGVV